MRRLATKTHVIFLALVVVVATIGAVAVAGARTQDSAEAYRTATAQHRSVVENLEEVGTIEPVTFADVAFPVEGTVATVQVGLGDTVETGQVLATLDPTSLQVAVREARAALDEAELELERALEGETGGSSTSGGNGTSDGASAAPASATTADDSTVETTVKAVSSISVSSVSEPVDEDLRAAQQAVLDAQSQVDADLAAAQEALESARLVCDSLDEATEQPEDSTTTTTAATATVDAAEISADTSAEVGACYDALGDALDAQTTLRASQEVLSAAVAQYAALAVERAEEIEAEANTPASGGASSSQQDSGSSAPSDPGSGSSSVEATTSADVPSSERLVAYQAAIDAAAADLVVAVSALGQAAIVSPIDGTVSSVGLAVGDEVAAASDTATIGVDGGKGFEVTAVVSVEDLPDLEVGQSATVTPDGMDTSFEGEVVNIGVTSSTEGASTTYPVTISLSGDLEGLRHGSVTSVSIVLAGGENVLAVPTSAVHADDGGHSVSVLADGEVTDVDVEIGAIGADWTEVSSGVEAGDVVVLADLDEPLPGSATEGGSSGDGPGGPPPAN